MGTRCLLLRPLFDPMLTLMCERDSIFLGAPKSVPSAILRVCMSVGIPSAFVLTVPLVRSASPACDIGVGRVSPQTTPPPA
jgi:hypothetical protein